MSTNVRKMRVALRVGIVALGAVAFRAQAEKIVLAPYTFEIAPSIGLNLPYDLWGTPGSLTTYALRGTYHFTTSAGVQVGGIYQHAGPDKAFTGEAGFNYELMTADLNTFFIIGLHYSMFKLQVDRNAAGVCQPANCLTDSGSHSGIFVGAGLQIPLTTLVPLRLSMKFYQNPQVWLLLEAGVGIRF